jgi:hypothetical protein
MASDECTPAVVQQSDDLTTCCVCYEVYDEGNLKPKFLTCFHTFCLTCVKVRALSQPLFIVILSCLFRQQKLACDPPTQVTCPKCKAVCLLPRKGPEALATNVYVLNNIQLKNAANNQQ